MSHWFVYWFVRLDGIKGAISTVWLLAIILLSLTALTMVVSWAVWKEEDSKGAKAVFKRTHYFIIPATVVMLLCICANALIPTTKEAAVIYLLPKIANSETASELANVPPNLAKMLNEKTEEWLSEQMGIKEKSE